MRSPLDEEKRSLSTISTFLRKKNGFRGKGIQNNELKNADLKCSFLPAVLLVAFNPVSI
jgi:hypothetical protein